MNLGRMATSDPFLNVPHGAYYHRDVPPVDEELTHVGPGTPGGEWLRRFWHPVFVSDELKNLPKAIRILGEDLVLFRDHSGQIGLLELHCSHRGTSLEFGQVQERGIRCCYHAWCYDVDGKILDTPGEPADSTLKDWLYHGAYPTLEYKGLVFAYMGPPNKRPAFPIYDVFDLPGYKSVAGFQHFLPCNWLQTKENAMDPAHVLFLHTLPGNEGFADDLAHDADFDYMESPIGLVHINTRRIEDVVWVYVCDLILPNINQGPEIISNVEDRPAFNRAPWMTWWDVPVDDTHNIRIGYWYGPEDADVQVVHGFGQMGDRPYEERQRAPGDYDVQVSQRPIAVHGLEHLVTSDRGVILMRNAVRQGIQAVRNGQDPKGVSRTEGHAIPTYGHERMLRIPRAPTPEEDRRLLRETGRRVAEEYIRNPTPA
jgi:nitrite reductase/ring-hydroxylating ferredoxin subunit